MKSRLFVLLAVAFAVSIFAAQGLTADEAKEAGFKATCPMSGHPAKEASAVDFKGKKVYFCCDNCPKAFALKKDDKAVLAKVALQWLETGQIVQTACPVSGREVNPDTLVAVKNAKVGFCCNNCKGKFEKASDDEKLAMAFGTLEKGFTLQTKCPVTNKPIDITKSIEHDGKTVYFCCPGCDKAFKADPAKYTAKLPQFSKN